MERFDKTFEFIKRVEGGYNKIPSDTGGQTIFGIAQAFNKDLALWGEIKAKYGDEIAKQSRITGSNPLSKKITRWVASRPDLMQEIRDCYYNRYWVASCAYCFDAPLDAILFDSYFNMGIAAKRLLQEWAGVPESNRDGILGKQSKAAIRACQKSPAEYIRLRWEYYQTRPSFAAHGNGWRNRLLELANFCNIKIEL